MLFSLNCIGNDIRLLAFKGNNSCKSYNFGIKVGNVQIRESQHTYVHLNTLTFTPWIQKNCDIFWAFVL